ncbi:MAG: hypothetical protein NC184_03500 [Roseburia sp.]|nr:hypothetical protein [Roseburia sp.]
MKLKDKIRSVWSNMRKKGKNKSADAELAADEVLREEVFPKKTRRKSENCDCNGSDCDCDKSAASSKKPLSKRSRPTNDNYRMIDRDDGTCDSGKS